MYFLCISYIGRPFGSWGKSLGVSVQAPAATGDYCYKAAVGRILVVSSFRTLQQQGNDHGLGKGIDNGTSAFCTEKRGKREKQHATTMWFVYQNSSFK